MAATGTVGMKDVARHAGVSVGTVSNVLNRPDIVSPDRRERVEAAIAELGYVRNDAARQLKMGRSSTVGAIVLDSGNPFYTQLVGGIESAAEDSQLMVIAGSTGNREQRERLYLSLFEEQRVRGILLASTGRSAGIVESIRGRGTPVVLVESEPDARGSSVSVDDIAGGEIAVQHLAALGRRRIGVVAARQDLRQVADRLSGARRAAEAAGIEIEVLEAEDLTVLAGRTVGEAVVATQHRGASRRRVLRQRSARRGRSAGLRLPPPGRRARGDRPGGLRRHRLRPLDRGAADLRVPARGSDGSHRPRAARGGDRRRHRPAAARQLHPDAGGAGVDDGLRGAAPRSPDQSGELCSVVRCMGISRCSCVTCFGSSSSRECAPSNFMVRTICSERIAMVRSTPCRPPAMSPYR